MLWVLFCFLISLRILLFMNTLSLGLLMMVFLEMIINAIIQGENKV